MLNRECSIVNVQRLTQPPLLVGLVTMRGGAAAVLTQHHVKSTAQHSAAGTAQHKTCDGCAFVTSMLQAELLWRPDQVIVGVTLHTQCKAQHK